jgi:4-amino-4-deoxy-L-arabinose transferase-like glycosyltransferase
MKSGTSVVPKRLSVGTLCLLSLCWIVPGLMGHDPWKPGEPTYVGIVSDLVRGGDWVVPTLAGEPFMEKPPLIYVSGALFASTLSPRLPLHDAARLVTGVYMALTLLLTGLSGRELYGSGRGTVAVVILLGCVGLVPRMHQLLPDVPLLMGFALALFGLALSRRRPLVGGLAVGVGAGVGFLSKGLLAPGIVGATAVALPLLFRPWRSRDYATCLATAAIAALPWLTIWPFALYERSPQLFWEWFWDNNWGRFLGLNHLGPKARPFYYLTILPWFAWPAFPLALWAVWQRRSAGRSNAEIQLPLVTFLIMLTVLSLASDGCELYATPILLPLALLAAASADSVGSTLSTALDWFAVATFGVIAALLWLGWTAMLGGYPAVFAEWLAHYVPGYVPQFNALAFWAALASTALWLGWVWRVPRCNTRWLIRWAAGTTLVWTLIMTLWLPVGDARKSYRSMFDVFRQSLPPRYSCIASRSFGEHERAMLYYSAGIVTRRVEVTNADDCDLLLIGDERSPSDLPDSQWEEIWEGGRRAYPGERYRLYRRTKGGAG